MLLNSIYLPIALEVDMCDILVSYWEAKNVSKKFNKMLHCPNSQSFKELSADLWTKNYWSSYILQLGLCGLEVGKHEIWWHPKLMVIKSSVLLLSALPYMFGFKNFWENKNYKTYSASCTNQGLSRGIAFKQDPVRIQGFNDKKFEENYSWKRN